MGGGDLNMKKSWHPLLMKNQERVWKEEQKALEEQKKLAQLKKEKEEERQIEELRKLFQEGATGKKISQRLDWMYAAGPTQSRSEKAREQEDYLLGRKRVDGLIKDPSETNRLKAGSQDIFVNSMNPSANSVHDMQAKIREDPLLMMKRNEQERIKAIMSNPAKLKQLKQLKEGGKQDREHKYKYKKEKKYRRENEQEKPRKRRRDSSVSADGLRSDERKRRKNEGAHVRQRSTSSRDLEERSKFRRVALRSPSPERQLGRSHEQFPTKSEPLSPNPLTRIHHRSPSPPLNRSWRSEINGRKRSMSRERRSGRSPMVSANGRERLSENAQQRSRSPTLTPRLHNGMGARSKRSYERRRSHSPLLAPARDQWSSQYLRKFEVAVDTGELRQKKLQQMMADADHMEKERVRLLETTLRQEADEEKALANERERNQRSGHDYSSSIYKETMSHSLSDRLKRSRATIKHEVE